MPKTRAQVRRDIIKHAAAARKLRTAFGLLEFDMKHLVGRSDDPVLTSEILVMAEALREISGSAQRLIERISDSTKELK